MTQMHDRAADQESLTINLFGSFQAFLHGEALPEIQARGGERLLAYLILTRGHTAGKDTVAQTLWPDTGSRDSLNQSISHLRKALREEGWRLQVLPLAIFR